MPKKSPYKNRYVPPTPKLEQKKVTKEKKVYNTDDMIDEVVLLSNHMNSFVFVSTEEYKCFLMELGAKQFYTFDLHRNDIFKSNELYSYIKDGVIVHTLVKTALTNKEFMDWLEGKITRMLER
jgi:hypothetical protein